MTTKPTEEQITVPPMRRFCETQGKPPFDWNAFLANAHLKSDEDWEEAEELSASWVTCACGNQCSVIARVTTNHEGSNGHPKDDNLMSFGHHFYLDICARNVDEAKRDLAKIEARSAVLILQHYAARP